jgi:FkbM family methyltransferase
LGVFFYMMLTYSAADKLKIINEYVDGLGPWLWTAHDKHCWDIIKEDWELHHSKNWFNKVKRYDVAVQAGGCCGLYPRLLSMRFRRVYTFEPDPMSFHCLVNNCQFDSIIKLNAALGDERGLVGLAREESNVGMNKIEESVDPGIPMMTIDDLHLNRLDLLALDLEGHEAQALAGAACTIEKLRPVVIIEAGEKFEEQMKLFDYALHTVSSLDVIYAPRKRRKD